MFLPDRNVLLPKFTHSKKEDLRRAKYENIKGVPKTRKNYQYDYDAMDNITDKVTEHGDYGYEYDALHRLVDVDNPEAAGLTDEEFTYDNVGNRKTTVDSTSDWDYNGNNELEISSDSNGDAVGGNPVVLFDSFGLSQCDIDVASEMIKEEYPDLANYPVSPYYNGPADGEYLKGETLVWVNVRFLGEKLERTDLRDLLHTIVEEQLHATPQYESALNPDGDPKQHPLLRDEADRRAAKIVQDYFLRVCQECTSCEEDPEEQVKCQ